MKIIVVSILACCLITAASVIGAVVLSVEPQRAVAGEPCVGLGCWPPEPAAKYRPAYRPTLPPVW
jgi:hypothetical protein